MTEREISVSFTDCTFDGVKVPVSASRGGWMPIETAPRDGTEVLLFTPGTEDEALLAGHDEPAPYTFIGLFDAKGEWVTAESELNWYTPTHWLPLPEPPSEVTS